jgi:hypothetical protein
MSCPAEVIVQETSCNVVQVVTAGPQGPTGPIGNSITGPTGPTGPPGSGGAGSGFLFQYQVNATLSAGSTDNFSPSGYIGGTTNCLVLTPNPAGSTLVGISATGVPSGFPLLIWNSSSTTTINFTNQASTTPTNQFACPGAGTVSLGPQAKVILVYIGGQWTL